MFKAYNKTLKRKNFVVQTLP